VIIPIIDFVGQPFLFRRFVALWLKTGDESNTIPGIIKPSDSIEIRFLLFLYLFTLSLAGIVAILCSGTLSASRLPQPVTLPLCVLAIASTFYVRLRSHFSWEKKYLK
jgi:hypothetical protein